MSGQTSAEKTFEAVTLLAQTLGELTSLEAIYAERLLHVRTYHERAYMVATLRLLCSMEQIVQGLIARE